jgi:hypothetical protein
MKCPLETGLIGKFSSSTFKKESNMKIKIHTLKAFFAVAASAVLLGAVDSARAADAWFVLSEQTLKSADPSVEIKSEGDRWNKNVKKVKFSVEGADVQVTKIVLMWDNRPDKTISDVGTLKAGGQTAPADAPGLKGRLKGVKIQYKIIGDAPTATFKVWGFD